MSVSTDGTQGNAHSIWPAVSDDGRFVAFSSYATNLVPGDANGWQDVFVRDTLAGTTKIVSVATDGTQGNSDSQSYNSFISGNGRFVAFMSWASNLVPGDTNGRLDVLMRDTVAGTTTRVSVASDGTQANDGCWYPVLSEDGRYVAFETSASNLVPGDTNGLGDIFVRDTVAGTTKIVSVASDGTQGNHGSPHYSYSISADGRYLAFDSDATNLVPGDTNNQIDIFVRDMVAGTTKRVSVATDGTQGDDLSIHPSISADGRYVAFASMASNLDPDAWPRALRIFVRDTVAGTTKVVSVATDGTQENGYSDSPDITPDGRYVAFQSWASNLVPGDSNGRSDIFVRDTVAGTTTRVSMGSDGAQGNDTSELPAISADGRFVAFDSSATNLVTGDTNSAEDTFVRGPLFEAPTRLEFSEQPGGAHGGVPFSVQPVVTAKGGNGTTATGYTGAVTLSIKLGTGTTGAVLSGTTTVNCVAGVATFANIGIDRGGTSYVLTAASPGLSSADSSPFNNQTAIVRVSPTGDDSRDGSTWADAKRTVQAGVNQASTEAWVAKGTYAENVIVSASVALYGGFAGTETARSQRNWRTNVTVLDGGGPSNVVVTSSGPAFVVDGFSVRNGVSAVSASSGTATVTNCAISGCYYALMRVSTISNSTITGNTTGIWWADTVENCTINGNGDPIISATNVTNCIISGNSGCSQATTVTNCTIVGNRVCGIGAATIQNSIVAFNDTGVSGTAALSHNDVFGNVTADYDGMPNQTGLNGNISVDPRFVDGANGDYHLTRESPCRDAGDNGAPHGMFDIDGDARVINGTVDIGADELNLKAIRVRFNAPGPVHDGATWDTAFLTVQEGIAATTPVDDVWVASGTYAGALTLKQGNMLYGGFAGTETALGQRNWTAHVTTLDGGMDLGIYLGLGNWSDKGVDGFTLRNGSLSGNHYGPLTLTHCEFQAYPLSIYEARGLSITDCRIEGGPIFAIAYNSGVTITSSRITDAPSRLIADGDITITDDTVSNSALRLEGGEGNGKFVLRNSFSGAGVDLAGGMDAVVDRNTFSGSGGTALIAGLSPIVISNNCVYGYDTAITGFPGGTVVGNTLVANGTAFDVSGLNALFANNIIAYNTSAGVEEHGTYHNNCFYGNTNLLRDESVPNPIGANGNISADPRFVDPVHGNWRLLTSSPCINGGDDSAVPSGSLDLDRRTRIVGPHVDIGAYEYPIHVGQAGFLLAWGCNDFGQLGNGTTVRSATPDYVKDTTGGGRLANVAAASSGWHHSLAVTTDGKVWSWGRNGYGQLGGGAIGNQTLPYEVESLRTAGIIAVAAGYGHSIALSNDGTVWVWGNNGDGVLGLGDTTNRSTPVHVPSLSNVIAVSAGYGHSLALLQSGRVMSCGLNNLGQLGLGDMTSRSVWTEIPGLNQVTKISAGNNNSLFVTASGALYVCGSNFRGQLGLGLESSETRLSPVPISSLPGVNSASVGYGLCVATTQDGRVWAWGMNDHGQVGNCQTGNTNVPGVVQGVTNGAATAAGYSHSLATSAMGDVYSWGDNSCAQCGDANPADHLCAGLVSSTLLRGITGVYAGQQHSLAITGYAVPPFHMGDVRRCLFLAGGLGLATVDDMRRLDVIHDAPPVNRVNILDATRILRIVAGLDPNP